MYAVIKTGGKQYRVQPGDVLVVEKLDGEAGAEIAFDQVLMLGDGGEVTLGGPLIDGAVVRATLIETRKGDKVKVFKKIRRQGYRRTRGHRQIESVLRVTGLEGAGLNAKWDGEVDMTPRAVLNARARGLAASLEQVSTLKSKKNAPKADKVDHAPTTAKEKTAAKEAVEADVVDEQEAAEMASAKAEAAPKAVEKAPAKAKAAPAKAAPKADAASKAPAKKAAAKSDEAKAEPKAAAKPKAAPKAKK